MKIHYFILIFFSFLYFLNCEEDLRDIITEESLKENLINIFPILRKEFSSHKLPKTDEFVNLSFEFQSFTPDIFSFKFDENGILNIEFNAEINLNGSMNYYLRNILIKRKFTVSIKNIIIKEKIRLKLITYFKKYEIIPFFISEPDINYNSIIHFHDSLGEIIEMEENIRKDLLESFFIKYIRLYNKNIIELTIKYNDFLIN